MRLEELRPLAAAVAPGAALREVRLTAGEPVEFRFERGAHVRLDPGTGEVLGTRERGRSFFGWVEKVHKNLLLGKVGRWVVTAATVTLLALLVSGLALWWPKQWRQLKGAVTLALGRRGRALHFNLHNTLGFWASLPLAAMALTGAIMAVKPLGEGLRQLGGYRPMPPPAPVSPQSLPAASLDALRAAAEFEFPAWRQLRFHSPRPVREQNGADALAANDVDLAWRVEVVEVGVPHEHARSRIWLDPRTAEVLRVDRFADLPWGARWRMLARPLHDGSLWGRPSQAVAFVAVLVLLVLSVTGVALGWLRGGRAECGKRCRSGRVATHSTVKGKFQEPAPPRPSRAMTNIR